MIISVKNMERTEQKVQIRSEYKKIRNSLTAGQVKEWSDIIISHLISSELFQQAEEIYFYYPLCNEVNLLPAAARALKLGKRVGFPRTEGEVIRFYQVKDLSDFKEGCFHVMEPVSVRALTAERPLILTPGLVFDDKKNRMGYGKGYYDRYFATFPEAVKVGIAYELQIARSIPVDEYDIAMDYILTERRKERWQ